MGASHTAVAARHNALTVIRRSQGHSLTMTSKIASANSF